jgi:16S rRNA (guanine966-N2)-methyltransferase
MRSNAHTEQDIALLAIYYYTRFARICQIIGLLLHSLIVEAHEACAQSRRLRSWPVSCQGGDSRRLGRGLRFISGGVNMKVIGGTARGRNLSSVPGTTTRPITARVKKALFDILGDAIPGSRFLDLFAGSGSVGIEALSRGADECVFVEKSPRAVAIVRRNLQTTGLDARAQVLRDDAFRYIGQQCSETFDIIYVAPPQYEDLWAEALLALDRSSLVEDDGIVVAQIFPKEYRPLELRVLELYRQRRYGSTLLCFYTSSVAQESVSA